MEEMMRSLILSAVSGLSTLGLYVGTVGDAQAQRRGRDSDGGRGGFVGRGYYGRGYYGRGYYGGYYGSSDYYPSTSQSYYYPPGDTSRYTYYWSNGWYICYDNVSGQYWYRGSDGSWYVWQ
jgi:hypothetical protein